MFGSGVAIACVIAWLAGMFSFMRPLPYSAVVVPSVSVVPESGYAAATRVAESVAQGVMTIPDGPGAPGLVLSRASETPDSEWLKIRTETFDFAFYITTSAVALRPNKLFRHKSLNPRDVYLSPEKRAELVAMLEPLKRELLDLLKKRHSVTSTEMQEIMDRGGAATVRLQPGTPLDSALMPAEAGVYDVLKRRGDTVYLAKSQNMPGSSLIESVMHAKGVDMGAAIAAWFFSNGMLTESEYGHVLEALSLPVGPTIQRR